MKLSNDVMVLGVAAVSLVLVASLFYSRKGDSAGAIENFQSRGNPYNQRGPSFFQSYAFRLGKQRLIDAE